MHIPTTSHPERFQEKKHDKGRITDIVFSDFSKAFDKIAHGHNNLLSTLGEDGLRRSINNWLKIIFINRKIKVVAEGEQSEEVTTGAGVSQA